jgi:hypothetical protein
MMNVRAYIVWAATYLMIMTVMIFWSWWGPVSSSKTPEPGRVHLFLKKVTRAGIMNVGVILQFLKQFPFLRIVRTHHMIVELRECAIGWILASRKIVLIINTTVILRKLSLTVL